MRRGGLLGVVAAVSTALAGCSSILGIGDTTLGADAPPVDAPVLVADAPITADAPVAVADAPFTADAPLLADAPFLADARLGDAPLRDAPLPDAPPPDATPPDACSGECTTAAQCSTASPICAGCVCRVCDDDPACADRALLLGGNAKLCSAAGLCVECRNDGDCHGARPTCDTSAAGGTCVAPVTQACGSMSLPNGGTAAAAPVSAYDFGGSFTLEAWVRPSVRHGSTLLVGRVADDGGGAYGLYLNVDGLPFFQILSDAPGEVPPVSAAGTAPLPLDIWTHVAGTYDIGSHELDLWVNGSLIATADDAPPRALPDTPLSFGSHLEGNLDEVRLSKGLRYQSSFIPERFHLPTQNDVALFHFDEANGSYALDTSPLRNDAHLAGGAAPSSTCQYYRCGSVRATGGFVLAFSIPAQQPAGSFTLEAFVQPTDLDGGGGASINLVDRALSGIDQSYRLYIDTATRKLVFAISCNGMTTFTAASTGTLQPFVWSHVAAVFQADMGQLWMFVDGHADTLSSGITCTVVHNDDGPVLVASSFGGFARFHGFIDELRMSSTARYTTFTFPNPTATMPGLDFPDDAADDIALYHFDETSGQVADDASPQQSNAMLNGDIAFQPGCY